MRKGQFERQLLEDETLREYLEPGGTIESDIANYRKFKLNIFIFIDALETYARNCESRPKRENAEKAAHSFRKLRMAFCDSGLEFNALELEGEIGFGLYFKTVPAKEAIPQKNALKRLYHYSKMTGTTPQETLARFTEADFDRLLGRHDTALLGFWMRARGRSGQPIDGEARADPKSWQATGKGFASTPIAPFRKTGECAINMVLRRSLPRIMKKRS